jgi:hypothetical protein
MSDSIQNNFMNEIIDIVISELSKEDVKKKISNYIVEPSFTYIFDKLYPYIIITSIIFVLLLLMVILIICILIRK